MTAKERNLLKGVIRRTFSRSDLRRSVLSKAKITDYNNPERPRVKTWYKCEACYSNFPSYQMQVDHIYPIIPVFMALEDMSWDDVIWRTWCEPSELKALCLECHKTKTRVENRERKKYRNERKKLNESKTD